MRRNWSVRAVGAIASLVLLVSCGPRAADDAARYRGWPAYGGGPEHIKYSALDQIDKASVKDLAVAWTYDTGEDPRFGTMHSSPLLADGVLYAAGPEGGVHAVDPATGARIWAHKPSFDADANTWFRGAPRGLMHWSDGADARIFSFAGRYVFALDAKTGEIARGFGEGGRIDLRQDLGRDPAVQDAELSSPGAVYRDLIILGSRMGEINPTSPGHIRAYDARTGALRWTFHTIPHPGEAGHETWSENSWTYSGGANSWSGMSLDEKRGIVFLGTGSAASDFYGADRVGDNLHANSVLALDAATGKLIWSQQIVRHDLWDRDLPAPPSLVTVKRDGRMVDAVAQTTKSGHIWLLDRETGEPLFPLEEVAAPPSDLPGEVAATSQRVPTLPEPFARQTLTEEELTQRTPEAAAAVRKAYRAMDPHEPFGPPSLKGRPIYPGFDGGGEWGGGAFDPETNLFYVNANEVPWILRMEKTPAVGADARASDAYAAFCSSCHGADRRGSGEFPSLIGVAERRDRASAASMIANGGGRMPGFASALDAPTIAALAAYVVDGENGKVDGSKLPPQPFDNTYKNAGWPKFVDPDGYPASAPPWGSLTAIDLNTGKHVWRRTLGFYPDLAAEGVAETGTENYGGPVVTAGGLVFIGATVHDRRFRAFDKSTGELLWEHELPASGIATPAVYEAGGRQFVVIAAGGPRGEGHPRGASYVAFALPQ